MNNLFLMIILMLPVFEAFAEVSKDKGLRIAEEMELRDTGWMDQQSKMQMILRNGQGQEANRVLRVRNLEVENDGDKILMIFDKPLDLKGTSLLSFTHATEPDDQWLYIPALKRVKRISSANKSGPFMGSEFAYEDLTSQELEKYNYKWLRDESIDGHEAFVIERYPTYEHSGYKKQVVWVDKNIFQAIKIDYYGRNGTLFKTLTLHGYEQYIDKHYRPEHMEMTNHQTGKSTSLIWEDYRFRSGLNDSNFNRTSLKRMR